MQRILTAPTLINIFTDISTNLLDESFTFKPISVEKCYGKNSKSTKPMKIWFLSYQAYINWKCWYFLTSVTLQSNALKVYARTFSRWIYHAHNSGNARSARIWIRICFARKFALLSTHPFYTFNRDSVICVFCTRLRFGGRWCCACICVGCSQWIVKCVLLFASSFISNGVSVCACSFEWI